MELRSHWQSVAPLASTEPRVQLPSWRRRRRWGEGGQWMSTFLSCQVAQTQEHQSDVCVSRKRTPIPTSLLLLLRGAGCSVRMPTNSSCMCLGSSASVLPQVTLLPNHTPWPSYTYLDLSQNLEKPLVFCLPPDRGWHPYTSNTYPEIWLRFLDSVCLSK